MPKHNGDEVRMMNVELNLAMVGNRVASTEVMHQRCVGDDLCS
jgi:hypothetical protein